MYFFFFFNDTATTEIYTLSLHDALPISPCVISDDDGGWRMEKEQALGNVFLTLINHSLPLHQLQSKRSEEHTSELQSRQYLVCRLLLEKKKTINYKIILPTYISDNSHVY